MQKGGAKMKKSFMSLVSVFVILCLFICTIPAFSLTNGDFIYEIVENQAVITAYSGTASTVTVPAQIDGYSVYSIGDAAFKDNETVNAVTVSNGVKSVGASAFENCTALSNITLPESIIHIGEKAIYNTAFYNNRNNWKEKYTDSTSSGGISIGNGIPQISWEDIAAKNLEYLYLGKNLIEITYSGAYTLKNGTLVIADGAFSGCEADSVSFSTQLVTIGNNAFKDCKNLKAVTITENVDYIGESAFENCTSLEKISFPDKEFKVNAHSFYNTGYYNTQENWENGALYVGCHLIASENKGETLVKEGTKYIIEGALGNSNAVIPATVTYIDKKAFTDTGDVTIFGYSDTFAQAYSQENNIRFVDLNSLFKGDVDFDGDVDNEDYDILCSVCTTRHYESYAISLSGDLNEDGAVDGFDLLCFDLIRNNYVSTIKGDADGDGDVDRDDYNLLVQISSSMTKVSDNFMFDRCDLNYDGAVDGFDAVYLDLALNNTIPLI